MVSKNKIEDIKKTFYYRQSIKLMYCNSQSPFAGTFYFRLGIKKDKSEDDEI